MELKNVIAKVKEWSKTLDPDEKAALDQVLDKVLADEELQKVAGGLVRTYANAAPMPPIAPSPGAPPPIQVPGWEKAPSFWRKA